MWSSLTCPDLASTSLTHTICEIGLPGHVRHCSNFFEGYKILELDNSDMSSTDPDKSGYGILRSGEGTG
jgi:hypothetical protein